MKMENVLTERAEKAFIWAFWKSLVLSDYAGFNSSAFWVELLNLEVRIMPEITKYGDADLVVMDVWIAGRGVDLDMDGIPTKTDDRVMLISALEKIKLLK